MWFFWLLGFSPSVGLKSEADSVLILFCPLSDYNVIIAGQILSAAVFFQTICVPCTLYHDK